MAGEGQEGRRQGQEQGQGQGQEAGAGGRGRSRGRRQGQGQGQERGRSRDRRQGQEQGQGQEAGAGAGEGQGQGQGQEAGAGAGEGQERGRGRRQEAGAGAGEAGGRSRSWRGRPLALPCLTPCLPCHWGSIRTPPLLALSLIMYSSSASVPFSRLSAACPNMHCEGEEVARLSEWSGRGNEKRPAFQTVVWTNDRMPRTLVSRLLPRSRYTSSSSSRSPTW